MARAFSTRTLWRCSIQPLTRWPPPTRAWRSWAVPTITDVNFADDKSVSITFESAVYPQVKLGQYKAWRLPRPWSPSPTRRSTRSGADAERNARMITVDAPLRTAISPLSITRASRTACL